MWSYVNVARIDSEWGKYRALVVLADDGAQSAHFLKFQTNPTNPTLTAAITKLLANMNEAGAAAEFERIVFDGAPFDLKYQNASAFAARFREMYRNATALRCQQMAYWIIERINDATFTDTQVRNAFGLTVGEYNTLKAKMTTLHDLYAETLAARGE